MRRFTGWISLSGAALIASFAAAADANDLMVAVAVSGTGTLTKCRDWFAFRSCHEYNRIEIPERIAVGDQIELTFGSNPKAYVFPVVGIRREGEGCRILSTATGALDDESIMITQCRPTATIVQN
jgi:hypothetical protein